MYLENLLCVVYKSLFLVEVLIYKVICYFLIIFKRGVGFIFSLYFIILVICIFLLIEVRFLYFIVLL